MNGIRYFLKSEKDKFYRDQVISLTIIDESGWVTIYGDVCSFNEVMMLFKVERLFMLSFCYIMDLRVVNWSCLEMSEKNE